MVLVNKIVHWKCLMCDVANLPNVSALMQHILTHLGVEPTCSNLRKHFTNWLSDVPLKCHFCDETFCRSRDLDCHYQFHAIHTSWECERCKQMFSSHSDLRKYSHKAASKISHRVNRKADLKVDASCVSPPPRTFNCDRCDKSFLQPRNFHTHHLIHTVMRPFRCDECHKLFVQSCDLEEHRRVHEKEHKCMFCCKSYAKKGQLKQHFIAIHSGQRPFQCDLCEKTFTHRGNLNIHQDVHREKLYKCELCESSFASKVRLKQHYIRHSGNRPHKCDFCEMSFTQKCRLIIHNLVHSGEKPHKCYLCGKTFAHRCNLKKHIVVHTGKTS